MEQITLGPLKCIYSITTQPTNSNQMQLSIRCPSAPWENDTVPAEQAWDLCHDLSVEFGYARILDGEQIIGEYQDGR